MLVDHNSEVSAGRGSERGIDGTLHGGGQANRGQKAWCQ